MPFYDPLDYWDDWIGYAYERHVEQMYEDYLEASYEAWAADQDGYVDAFESWENEGGPVDPDPQFAYPNRRFP